jgi:hypothetical protein
MYNKTNVIETLEKMRVIEMPIMTKATEPIKGYKAIVRESDNELIRVVSDNYKVYQNLDAFNEVVTALDIANIKFDISKLALNKSAGRNTMHLSLSLSDISMDIDGHLTTASIEVFNSNDGTLAFQKMLGVFRLICTNGAIIGENLFKYKRRHTQFFNVPDYAHLLPEISNDFETFMHLVKKSKSIKMTDSMKLELIKGGFPEKIIKDLSYAYEKYAINHNEVINDYNTLWAYYSVLTNWITNSVNDKNIVRANTFNNTLMKVMEIARN